MQVKDIILHRLHNQAIAKPGFTKPEHVVKHLIAMQAQEYAQAKWAIGLRCTGIHDTDVEKAFNDGKIIRTHMMRPTWHFVCPEDLRWMQELTAHRVHAASASMYGKTELNAKILKRAMDTIAQALQGGNFLTREELKVALQKIKYVLYKETLVDTREHILTFIGSFLGIGIIGLLSSTYYTASDALFLIGSFGASAVLVYGVINSPLAQPRNLVGGHVISALVGVAIYKLIPGEVWLSSALAVSLSIVLMQITKTLHPPGGATALIANIRSEKIKALGFLYVLSPVLAGVLILLLIALICNNATPYRRYSLFKPKRIKQARCWVNKRGISFNDN